MSILEFFEKYLFLKKNRFFVLDPDFFSGSRNKYFFKKILNGMSSIGYMSRFLFADATRGGSTLLDATRRYSTLLNATRRYLTLLDASRLRLDVAEDFHVFFAVFCPFRLVDTSRGKIPKTKCRFWNFLKKKLLPRSGKKSRSQTKNRFFLNRFFKKNNYFF
jgi:hypothetical protein